MDLMHAVLKVANYRLFSRGLRLVNGVLRPRHPVPVRVYGQKLYAASLDRLVALWMRKWTSVERFEAQLWTELIKPGMVVVDVGGNLGLYTLLAAERVRPSGRVHVFEPEPENFTLLERNIAANNYDNVVAHRAAVADQVGSLTLFVRPEHHGDHRVYEPNGGGRVRLEIAGTTLDAVFADAPRVDVIKLDIQGAEGRALAGMTRTLEANPGVTVFSEFCPELLSECETEPREYLRRWRELGFRIQEIDDERRRLCEPDDDELTERCRKIRYTNLVLTRS